MARARIHMKDSRRRLGFSALAVWLLRRGSAGPSFFRSLWHSYTTVSNSGGHSTIKIEKMQDPKVSRACPVSLKSGHENICAF
jgi:hypothetical protein